MKGKSVFSPEVIHGDHFLSKLIRVFNTKLTILASEASLVKKKKKKISN